MSTETRPPMDEMLPEYDFSRGVRGKYADRYAEGHHVVVLSARQAENNIDQRAA